jgi:hypothetical protein
MSNDNEKRDARGRWTSNGGNAEQMMRDAGRFPVAPHDDQPGLGATTKGRSSRGGRFRLPPVLAALVGVGAGLGSAVLKPALRGRHGRR